MDDFNVIRHEVVMQGAVIVNEGMIYKRSENIVCAYIDMHSKYASFDMSCSRDDSAPEIWLIANEQTLHLDDTKDIGTSTAISFPDYVGWKVFLADCSRYTLSVCLVKDN